MNPRNGKPVVVLLVEDNPAHAELVIRSLEDHQVANEIHHVADGEAAMHYLRQEEAYADPDEAPRPDVILLDLRLPKLDGLDVLKQIKDNPALRQIPVVMLTTSKAESDIFEAYRHHVNSYLVKPINFDDFKSLMEDLGFYWLIWNQKPGEIP